MVTKQEAIAELARRELKRRGSLKESSTKVDSSNGSALDTLLAGPFITNKIGDVPSLLTSAIDGLSGGAIGNVVEQPKEFGVSGMTGAGIARGANMLAGFMGKDEPLPSSGLIPKPETASGAISGLALATGIPLVTANARLPRVIEDVVTNKAKYLSDVRGAFFDAKSSASEKFGAGLETIAERNPNKTTTFRPVMDQLAQEIAYEPKLRNAIRRVPLLEQMLDDPKLADNIPLKEAQSLVNDLQSKIPSSKMRGLGVRSDDIPLLDAVHNMRAQMLEAFPQLKKLRSSYGEIVNDYNLLRNKIKPGSLAKNLQTNFGDSEVFDAAKRLLKDSPQTLDRIRSANIIRKAGKGALLLGEGALGLEVVKRVLK